MRSTRYILIVLFLLCYRGLSAQEFDLYDFRYYKRFDTTEELLAPEADSVAAPKFQLNRQFSTRALDYNFAAIRFARRGVAHYERKTRLNGVQIPFIGASAIRALQLGEVRSANETSLRIDSLKESRTSAGFAFSSRNTPYSISLATAHKLENDLSLAANLTARTGRDLYVKGLFGNALEFNGSIAKRWGERHALAAALFINPSMRSTRLASTKEAFTLTGNNLYNPAWGYQNGRIRSSRIRREVMPTAFIGYDWRINEQTTLSVAAALTAGVEKYSSLEWFNAQTPQPDNYRYMPSFFNDEDDIFHAVENAWINNDVRYTQIDFDRIIATNILNGDEATYAISDRVRRTIHATFRGGFHTKLSKGTISYGVEASIDNQRSYKMMRDLLQAKYIIDLDYFLLDDDTFGNYLQNNINAPNRHIVEGERFGYDYAIRRNDISAYATYRYSDSRLNVDVAAEVGYSNISRRGFYRKELFANNSFGVSKKIKLAPYALRINAEYLVADNHLVRGNISTEARPNDPEDMFLQSQYNNRIISKPTLQTSYNAEVQYIFQKPNLAFTSSLFLATALNGTEVRHLYDDLSSEYTDVVVSNVNRLRFGLEVEAEYRFASNFRAVAAASIGRYMYASNSLVTIYTDTANTLLADHISSYIKGLSLGNTPQVAITAGLSYYNKGWWASLNANYAGLRYIDPSYVMRTDRTLALSTSPEQFTELNKQERLRDAFTIDISISKSLYISRLNKKIYSTSAAPRFEDKHPKSRLIFRVGVRNLLGSTNIVYSAYEASRLQRYKLAGEYIYNRQASRYMYAYPRTFHASATFAF